MALLLKKTLLKSTTSLSINERFTQLRGNTRHATIQSPLENIRRENNALQHQASIKNRRLAQQMERRPTVMAALKIKKKTLRQRLGLIDQGASVRDRLFFPGSSGALFGGRARVPGRGRGRGLLRGKGGLRGQSQNPIFETRLGSLTTKPRRDLGILQPRRVAWRGRRATGRLTVLASPRGIRKSTFPQRSQVYSQRENQDGLGGRYFNVPQSNIRLRGSQLRGSRARGGRSREGRSLGGGAIRGRSLGSQVRGSQLRGRQLRGRQLRGGQLRGGQLRGGQLERGQQWGGQLRGGQLQRGRQSRGRQLRRGQQRGNIRGGQLRGSRGSSRGRAGTQSFNNTKPSKEELDMELDQYMANTRTHLNHQLDSYMGQGRTDSWH